MPCCVDHQGHHLLDICITAGTFTLALQAVQSMRSPAEENQTTSKRSGCFLAGSILGMQQVLWGPACVLLPAVAAQQALPPSRLHYSASSGGALPSMRPRRHLQTRSDHYSGCSAFMHICLQLSESCTDIYPAVLGASVQWTAYRGLLMM